MSDSDTGRTPAADNWDTYWHGAEKKEAFTGGGAGHPAIHAFWDELFARAGSRIDSPRMIDIASGNGAVIERAKHAFASTPAEYTCVDISASAVNMLRQRYPDVTGIVADARSIPLESENYDIVASQFGIEYAGLDAVPEMLRLVAGGGTLALLLHHRDGGIYRQSFASFEALQKLQQSRFIDLSIATFETGFSACRGGDRETYEAAAKQLVPAIQAVEAIMAQYGPNVADGTIRALYRDVGAIHGRLPKYDPAEVLDWLNRMQDEILAYSGRMSSMCNAAITETAFLQLCGRIRDDGFDIERSDALILPERGVPLAWAVIANRS
ncbi:MAG: class I SAM-dependent methyltransferase [Woeseiaceae bacterium]|nr:class I SAM-dependent methyltransferase [Woeseiaceae bacterium]